ncbi:CBS domain-containing protein [Pinibacter aurantiacus]|uniref:CBS domain-containing protein n=1 Tax=Pinibacter aurantiacus TaxID=2851599 RepID=A0A9E2SBM8_9BACT|nr:CBS domain-containing protein [Pinibacter aurantiacus]MBV4359157.1 CBS domain-containing protein [Pinibacter aurantiacus]
MLNKELISTSIPVLAPTDSVDKALQLMSDYHLSQLPVIAEEKFVGLIDEEELLNTDTNATIIQLQASFVKLAVQDNKYFFEAVKLSTEYNLCVIPVIEQDLTWVGAINAYDLLKEFAHMTGVNDPGGLIVLEMEKQNFSFSEISKLVETNDAQITQMNTYYDSTNSVFVVTVKINKLEISDIIATFQRYEYVVRYYFGEELYENELKNNYDHLMNYLNI